MITPTLLDGAALTGVKPTGIVFNHTDHETISIKFDVGESKHPTYNNFIQHHHCDSEEVSDEEHVAFLTLWLSRFVFYSRSMQIAKKFAHLAATLHRSENVALGQLMLASLYSSMTDVVGQIKSFGPKNPKKKSVMVHGPFWLLQLWLNATFSADMKPFRQKKVSISQDRIGALWPCYLPLTP